MRASCWLILALLLPLAACSEPREPGSAAASSASESPLAPVQTASSTRRPGRPLPAFQGYSLDDEAVDLGTLIGRRLLLFLFEPDEAKAGAVADAVQAIAGERAAHNFEVLGVAMGARTQSRPFVAKHALDFRIVDDETGRFAARLGTPPTTGLLVVDAEGYLIQGSGQLPSDGADATGAIETMLRDWLRLPDPRAVARPELGERPLAPDFSAPRLDGGEAFQLASTRPLVLIFFLHTCPHCHHALDFFKEQLPKLPEATRPELVGVSIAHRPADVREELRRAKLDFFPVVFDPDGSARAAYGAQTGVPQTFLIDAEGRIDARFEGWREDREPALTRMRLARLAGQTPPMLLHRSGYSGDEFCAVCHAPQHETWLLSDHARAFDTLVRHGAERKEECVGCHVVGFGQTGGYSLSAFSSHLEDVGCETCHGRGGPHLSPEHVKGGDYAPVCITCHDSKHSLGFDYASFVPRVSHAANLHLAGLSLEEKRALLAKARRPKDALLPTRAHYVGSAACQSCHPAEHATWSEQPHARSLASLERKGKTGDADCLACHTTGYGSPGGFPKGAAPAQHADLAAVGCESCHGPGGDHVGADAKRIGSILSLGDKCDSCVILQICGGCHDDANDPGFEFAVEEKIERQRHGTIEPGTGRPKDSGSARVAEPQGETG